MRRVIALFLPLALAACHGKEAAKDTAEEETPRPTTEIQHPDVGDVDRSDSDVPGEEEPVDSGAADADPDPPEPPMGLVFTAADATLPIAFRAASTSSTSILLELVARAPLTGFSIGLELPIDPAKVEVDDVALGNALDPGLAPRAFAVAFPDSGPKKDTLLVAISQKAAGAGARPTNSAIPSGAVFFSVRLSVRSNVAPGVLFDGTKFDAGLLDRGGANLVGPEQFGIGRLEFF